MVLGKNGKPLKDRHGNNVIEVVRNKAGKVIYEPYEIKVLNTIDFKKSLHYNPFPLLYKGDKKTFPGIQGSPSVCGAERTDTGKPTGKIFFRQEQIVLICDVIRCELKCLHFVHKRGFRKAPLNLLYIEGRNRDTITGGCVKPARKGGKTSDTSAKHLIQGQKIKERGQS